MRVKLRETRCTVREPMSVENVSVERTRTLHARLLSGSFILLLGSGLATATNFAYNIAVARFLGPSGYGHATVVYTLLILISAATLSFQIVAAKVVAQQGAPETRHAVYRVFHRAAWACGVLIAIVLLLFERPIAAYLNLPAPVLVTFLAAGAAFYVPLGSRRGFIQGVCGFRALAANLVLEGIVRLGGSFLLIEFGLGVRGVVAANSAAVAVAYLAAVPRGSPLRVASPLHFYAGLRETGQALVFFAGQVLINNCDIVLVKHFFVPSMAGLYAAVAMVGRVIFAFSSSVVNTMFPLVAGTRQEERRGLRVVATSSLLVVAIGASLALALRLAPAWIWTRFFGSGFSIPGEYGLPYLLSMYAVTTVIYSLTVVLITYEMSYKIANTQWVQLAFSGIIIAGISRFHASLQEVIWVQLLLMTVLLLVVGVPFIAKSLAEARSIPGAADLGPIRIVCPVSEDEVIAEFLRSDFTSPAFHEYRNTMSDLVLHPDLEDASDNAKRRALLFIRHLALWKELPTETRWYEVELRPAELDKVRVFPRAQWRKLARGDYSITGVLEYMRGHENAVGPAFWEKINAIGDRLQREGPGAGTVILIGRSENEPVTVLDGNHRLAAALLASPTNLTRLRVLCGLSPKMTQCCWYNTNLVTLSRYAKNVLAHLVRDPEAELARLLQNAG